LARRSLRISPISTRDVKAGVWKFLEETLQIDPTQLLQLPPASFRRAIPNRNSKIKDEIVVCFSSPQDRDYVKAQSYKLAGKENMSLRLELPSHLLGQHRVLSSAAMELRKGKPGSRTSVKFDDDNLRLVLDYKVGDGPWKRLLPEQAAAVGDRARPIGLQETSADDFRSLLGPATGANTESLGR
jgi:hypothetical protein